ncbi:MULTISPECIES: DUF3095 domain-containing protein [Aurantimonas]|uniref:DUF3095 domain-containing protein n=1 Tax=Aurantimonas TaxID=182269 RepID=UPI00040842E7|nr:DUF3095 domain-containing protein [Aurantimonas coralicida]
MGATGPDDGGTASTDLAFYEALPVSSSILGLGDASAYRPLPVDWVVGVADIVRSTDAVSSGGYKRVNTVAAAVIAAVANGLHGREFPFVFGGDGAGFALPAAQAEIGRAALASVAGWAQSAFGLSLRVAMVPVATIRDNGRDVQIARFAPSPDVSYAMFAGGGLAWAERQMKAGAFRIEPEDGATARPDLAGLSCRFSEIPARRDLILSVVLLPRPDASPDAFAALARNILELGVEEGHDGNPVPPEGPELHWPPAGLPIEAEVRKAMTGLPLWASRLSVGIRTLLSHLSFVTGTRVGAFDPARYRSELARNSDFRKFDDGLRMTLDCTAAVADRIEARLRDARAAGLARTGTHRQAAALMTCFVPSASRSDHVHFVDGAAGGYAAAAAMATADMAGRTAGPVR